jgi:small subunit ribosomal protein S14
MSKKSIIQRELKRTKLYKKHKEDRALLILNYKTTSTFEEKIFIHQKIQKLPRNSAKTRIRNRCWKTGRPRGFFRDFGLSRHVLREMAHQCLLPGLTKSSW